MSTEVKTGHEKIVEIVKIALMAAIISVLGPLSVPLPFTPVPVSFTIMAVYLTSYLLGSKTGTLSVIIYILVGLAGLPVFSGFTGGAAKLIGPTGGYIIGFIFIAIIGGFFVDKFKGNFFLSLLGMAIGTAICYLFGSLWLAYQASMNLKQALLAGVVPYVALDCAKMVIAVLLGKQVKPLKNKGLLQLICGRPYF